MPKSSLKIGPIHAATPTPLTPDGRLDRASVAKLSRRWIDIGLDGVMLNGTMGEGMYLPDATRDAFVEAALEHAGRKLTIFATAADMSRARMRERALRYAKMGAAAIVLCLPVGAAAAKAVADVKAVAEACPIPCAYYDIPANTGTTLVLNEILDILGHDNIVVMKDSSNNPLISQGLTSSQFKPKGVTLLHGIEYCVVHSALLGYDGVLHGGGALTARRVRRIWDATKSGKLDEALRLDRANSLFLGAVYNRFSRPVQNVGGQKHALMLLGAMDHDATVGDAAIDDAGRKRVAVAVEANRSEL